MSYVSLTLEYFPDPTRGVPVFYGYIYVGQPDTDPTDVGNQIPVTLRQSDGTEVAAAQPIRTGAGGVALYNGSPVQLLVNQNYSLTVLDEQGDQVYYIDSASPILDADSLLLANLKALTGMNDGNTITTGGKTVFNDGGGGTWVFSSADLSTEVGIDTDEGFYVAPDSDLTGASGAWMWLLTGKTTKTLSIPGGEQIDLFQAWANQDGAGKLFAFHFDMTATSGSSGTEPVRGLIGRLKNNDGSGDIKAIRVGVSDIGTAGANSLMAISADVTPNANTTNAWIMQLSEQGEAGVDGIARGITFDQVNANQWENGIVFNQGMEVNDAWIQASMGAGSGANARFLKLKDTAGTSELFQVDKTGKMTTLGGLDVSGLSTFNTQVTLNNASLLVNNTTRDYAIGAVEIGDYLNIIVGSVGEGFRLDVNRNVGLGGMTDFGSGARVLAMANATSPSVTPVGGGVLYVESGALKYIGTSGTVTTLGVA